ncbi:MAG: hypothetical protein FJW56_02930 [Actinobacteria bacterium]|nr:hypothetical protein [Actinomycetota bacterium]
MRINREHFGDFGKKEIIFPVRRRVEGGIRLMSFNSTAKAPERMHILRFNADELSRADTKATYNVARKLYFLGLNNTRVSFPNNIGKVIGWSYLNDTDYDLTSERLKESYKSEDIFALSVKTVDFNPAVNHDIIEKALKIDPRNAAQVYENIKPISKDSFFQPFAGKLDEMISHEVKNKIQYRIAKETKASNNKEYSFTTIEILGLHGDNRRRCFTVDPSKTKDRFVILGGYAETRDIFKLDYFIGDQHEVVQTNVREVVDIIIVIEPIPKCPIDYFAISDIFTQLLKAFPNTHSLKTDHFQNEKLIQEVIKKGVQAETCFFSNTTQLKLYTQLKANVWNNNLKVAHDDFQLSIAGKPIPITDLLLREGKQVTKEGNKIDHPPSSSKDIMDSLAILNSEIIQLEVLDIHVDR